MNKLLACLIFFFPKIAMAFPEMIRRGYTQCSSCHVSPTGGGVLKPYGKMSSRELLSAFGREGEETYFVPEVSFLNVGGDQRYINLSRETCDTKLHKKFLMQADFELSLSPIKDLTFVSSVGFYNVTLPVNKTYTEEQRRSYMLVDVSENLSFRIGRFFPAYGIQTSDHTLSTRKGLGFSQGLETYNLEAALKTSWAELFVTGINGYSGNLSSSSKGYHWESDTYEHGLSSRLTFLPADTINFSVSGQRLINETYVRSSYGVSTLVGLTKSLYLLAEIDKHFVDTPFWVSFVRIGQELIQGLHVLSTYETIEREYTAWHWGMIFYPRPHWEIVSEFVRRNDLQGRADEWVFMFHHYL